MSTVHHTLLPAGIVDARALARAMSAETLKWAVAFDGLPAPIKAKWAELVAMFGDQLEQHAGLGLVLSDVRDVVEDEPCRR